MKNGKIILGAASFIISAVGALAFKTADKTGAHQIYGTHKAPGVIACTATTCFVTAKLTQPTRSGCKSAGLLNRALTTWYTTDGNGNNCGVVKGASQHVTRVN